MHLYMFENCLIFDKIFTSSLLKLNLTHQANMDLKGNLTSKMGKVECLQHLPTVAKLRLVMGRIVVCHRKQKKYNDQRAPASRYYQIKDLQSLNLKCHLVTRGFHLWLNDMINCNICMILSFITIIQKLPLTSDHSSVVRSHNIYTKHK